MTPSVAAASPTVAPAAPFAVVSTAVHGREWWAEEAVRAGTGWSGLVAAALEMMIDHPLGCAVLARGRRRISPRSVGPSRCRDRAEATGTSTPVHGAQHLAGARL